MQYPLPSVSAPPRIFIFLGLCALCLIPFRDPLSALLHHAAANDLYGHAAVVPLVVAALLYVERETIFRCPYYSPLPGLAVLAAAILLQLTATTLTVSILALVIAWTGAFLACYGATALYAARFPLLFLLWMVPPPASLIERLSIALQNASADISHSLFKLLGIPVFRQGFQFSLPGLTVQVAEQCSGIRSTLALVITGVLLAYLFLKSIWRRAALVVILAFLGVFKNAVRIVFISGVSAYFDKDFMDGSLHHTYGGTVFSALAIVLVLPLLLYFRRCEQN